MHEDRTPRLQDHHIEHGAWQKAVAPPAASDRPAGLPAASVLPALASAQPAPSVPPAAGTGDTGA